jgi:hypothetical protein
MPNEPAKRYPNPSPSERTVSTYIPFPMMFVQVVPPFVDLKNVALSPPTKIVLSFADRKQ